jgi:hypothetical protein
MQVWSLLFRSNQSIKLVGASHGCSNARAAQSRAARGAISAVASAAASGDSCKSALRSRRRLLINCGVEANVSKTCSSSSLVFFPLRRDDSHSLE